MTAIQPMNVPQPVRLTVEQFELLDGSGAFEGYAKAELIEGAIYAMNAQYVAHAYAKSRLAVRLANALERIGSSLSMIVEGTVAMPPDSAPEPDISLAEVLPGSRAYIPLAAVGLVVEVADASIAFDLKEKATLYAKHSVPEYWVLELPAATIHQFWSPGSEGYSEARSIALGERVESLTIPDLVVESAGLI